MFVKEKFTVFMLTMRLGTQGFPIYFECFKGSDNTDAFKIDTLKQGIKTVDDLFKDTNLELIFLADRWFCSTELLDYIDSLGHTYCVRLKGNIHVYKDGEKLNAKKLKHRKHHAVVHKDVYITNKHIEVAVQNYSFRFGSIECMFKNQKSNGFNLNKISTMNIKSFTNMYSVLCVCVVYLTILGADFSKNSKCYRNIKITTHKNYIIDGKRIKKRVMSLFNTGLTLFKIAFNSYNYVR